MGTEPAATVSDTLTVWSPPARLDEDTVTVPVYFPAASVPITDGFGARLMDAGVAPLPGVTVIKFPPALVASGLNVAVNGTLPAVVVTCRACAAGIVDEPP